MRIRPSLLLGCASVVLLAACDLAPDYQPPVLSETQTATAYKEYGNWQGANPQDNANRGEWWKMFNDETLNRLEEEVTASNQTLKMALANYDASRAAAGAARAAYYPTIAADAGASRDHLSKRTANVTPHRAYNDFTFGADFSYEIDLWGRVRNAVTAAEDESEATAADTAGIALSLHSELASDYFALRGDDEAIKILDKTIDSYQKAYNLTKRRFDGGVSPEADLDQAETQLQNAKAQIADMRLQRAQLEHAIAVLTGQAPASFTLAPAQLDATLPTLSPGLPSTLLERRPDIAAAERSAAAANAEIGVARAAYFPTINLAGSGGFESAALNSLVGAPALIFSVGPKAALTLFDGGRISSLSDEAHANFEASAAAYRQTVLSAYQDVEDNLAALHHLHDEGEAQQAAQKSADRALQQANNRYKGGAVTYLDVVVVQNIALQAQLAAVDTRVRQLTSSVQLVRALGGGWQAEDMKAPKAEAKPE